MGLTDDQAYALTKRMSPELTEPERQFALIIARVETYYGSGWHGPGVGSNNWGAIQGTGPAGYFMHIDHHADGTQYTTKFRKYHDNDEAWLDLVAFVLKPNVRKVLNETHNANAALDVMRNQNRYFELQLSKYQDAFARNYSSFLKNTSFSPALSTASSAATIPTPVPTGNVITAAIASVVLYKVVDYLIEK